MPRPVGSTCVAASSRSEPVIAPSDCRAARGTDTFSHCPQRRAVHEIPGDRHRERAAVLASQLPPTTWHEYLRRPCARRRNLRPAAAQLAPNRATGPLAEKRRTNYQPVTLLQHRCAPITMTDPGDHRGAIGVVTMGGIRPAGTAPSARITTAVTGGAGRGRGVNTQGRPSPSSRANGSPRGRLYWRSSNGNPVSGRPHGRSRVSQGREIIHSSRNNTSGVRWPPSRMVTP